MLKRCIYVISAVVLMLIVVISVAIVVFEKPPSVRHEYVIWENAGLARFPMGRGSYIIEVVPGTNYVMHIFDGEGNCSIWEKFWYRRHGGGFHRSLFLLLGPEIAEGMKRDLHVANDTIELSGSRGAFFEFLDGASLGSVNVVLKQPRSSAMSVNVSGRLQFARFDGSDVTMEMLYLDLDKEFQIRSLDHYYSLWGFKSLADEHAEKKWGAEGASGQILGPVL